MDNENDTSQLNLLGIFHYVLGGIIGAFSCGGILHLIMGIRWVTGTFASWQGDAPPLIFGWFFVIGGAIFMIVGWSSAICMIISGRKLRQRKGRMFSMVIAAIECMMFPFGTILGVFTLIVLNKDSVKELYKQSVQSA